MTTYINVLSYVKRKFSNRHIEITISSEMHRFYANISWNCAETEVPNWSRKGAAESREKKERKVLTTRGEIPESTVSLRDTVYLNWGSRSGETRLGVSAPPRLCGLRAFSRAISSAASGRSSSRFSRSYASIDRSIARSMPVRSCRGTSDLSRRVELLTKIFVESSIENHTRLNREETQRMTLFFILALFLSVVWGVLVISLWRYRFVSRSRYVHQFYLHVRVKKERNTRVNQMSCMDTFNRFLEKVFR